ncbi:MAG: hypothetical protein ACTSYD_06895 [Candidatus Heimdallarchaeaceae archaeon]
MENRKGQAMLTSLNFQRIIRLTTTLRQEYPVKPSSYRKSVGRLLPHRICQILKELGYETWMNPNQGNGVDIKVWHNGRLVLVAEVLNWSVGSYLSEKRSRNIKNNLNQYNCPKVLIHTTLSNHEVEKFTDTNIIIFEIGYQLLPKYFYNFFREKNQIQQRRYDSKETREDLKMKIQTLMTTIIH